MEVRLLSGARGVRWRGILLVARLKPRTMSRSSSGLGRHSLKVVAGVRIPLGTRPHRLAAKDSAPSRRGHGFESRWGYHCQCAKWYTGQRRVEQFGSSTGS